MTEEEYERGEKFAHYQSIPRLAYYLTVSPDAPHVLLHARTDTGWQSEQVLDIAASTSLPTLGTQIALADIYALTSFGMG